eukprot:Protomagalhaensia_sp_Gyna_25__684@NODE_131_length_4993_cov_97_972951_g103_i0_p1_GENE_NODE_131_length_4993_cov_97_972951_g103_i0NODE_131_length_4993_cov_97_972951_g103_i0_p1_ORF_typecomplete_len366_score61_10SKA2/PF16740_5/0_036DUF4530/PF15039_6/24DUF4530/PF15039_6/49DUF4530/PF15039_6/1_4e03_NODE_131_length_4993_cov_97_972951_g103_i033294426
MSMLDFVKRAFAEGGAQMEFLASLLDCKDIAADSPLEDRFYLALAEILRLKTQVQTLQSQVSQIIQERDKMMLLIWTELSRLSHRINPDTIPPNTTTGLCDTPVRALVEEAARSLRDREDSMFRSLLGPHAFPLHINSSSNETPIDSNSSVRGAKRGRVLKPDVARSSIGLELDAKDEEIMRVLKEEATPVSALNNAGGSVTTGLPSPPTATTHPAQTTPEQRVLIDAWISKQVSGCAKSPDMLAQCEGAEPGDWWCHVCGSLAKDGPPGDHFCFGRFENHRDGLKVFCQYCRKGTARMPDLRVHFRKIVYCRDLRAQLKMALNRGDKSPPVLAPTASTVDQPDRKDDSPDSPTATEEEAAELSD